MLYYCYCWDVIIAIAVDDEDEDEDEDGDALGGVAVILAFITNILAVTHMHANWCVPMHVAAMGYPPSLA